MDSENGLHCPEDQTQANPNIQKQIRLTKSSASSYGFSISMDKRIGQYVVRVVTPGSPASKHDIQVGDIVYEINNNCLKNLNLNEIVNMVKESCEDVFLVTCRPTDTEQNNFKRESQLMQRFKSALRSKKEEPIPKKTIKPHPSRILGGISKFFSLKTNFSKTNEKTINNLSDNKPQDSLIPDENSDQRTPSFEILSHSKSIFLQKPPRISPIPKLSSPLPREQRKPSNNLVSIVESDIYESVDNDSDTITIYEHKMVVGQIEELMFNDDPADDWISPKRVDLWNLGSPPIDTEYMNDYGEAKIKINVENYYDKDERDKSPSNYMRRNRIKSIGERIAYVNNL
ncbi:Tyrosine-protein phosphatase non-receptor type 13 [Thelohanellus kitauei]|uniref:Tyrosine-protein phosphatase non-receptor type 13 n=1 Tax=Thelohanellus kitauei TaxID=669202 RepID=A0A0C2N3I1_THEKT|nr:Tyrosine-protein phosphatase non-receptor type 13 [Thelohanellus kitauei]